MRNSPVVVFAPYSAIWVHAYPEALVAYALKHSNVEVIYIPCDGMMIEGCAAMSSLRINNRTPLKVREGICNMCRKRRDALSGGLGGKVVTMDSLLLQGVKDEIVKFVDRVNVVDIMALEVDGFKVGRIALHETIIHYKLATLEEMDNEALADFRIKLLHVLLSLRVTQALVEKFSPARIITYNTLVSTNHIMMLAAERAGVPTFGLVAGGNMAKRISSLQVFRHDQVKLSKDWIKQFEGEWVTMPTTAVGVRDVGLHIRALTSGRTSWVYSPPKSKGCFDVRGYFNIAPDQKILLATLSSYDELFSSQVLGVMDAMPPMFKTQIEWMHAVIAYVAQRPNLFLIIRVHPREFPNQRNKISSKHAEKLAEAFVDLPPNVRINWPRQAISLYDLLPHVSVGLNGWSSVGKELAIMGIPVVLYTDSILLYPSSLNDLASDPDDYFLRIEQATKDGWSFERIRLVFRWLAVEISLGTINIGDRFAHDDSTLLLHRFVGLLRRSFAYRVEASRLNRPMNRGRDFAEVILDGASVVNLNILEQCRLDDAQEDQLIREELKDIVNFVYSEVPRGASSTIDALRAATSAV